MQQRKKKAFTLTELLVVVVIIGVLSAVVLPKFNKTLETRRTTEAEDIMRAVRTEQEYRCASERAYAVSQTDLSSLSNNTTKNYQFSFETTGVIASRTGKTYRLKMPSYADGRICCEGSGCSSLNKNYPSCDDLTNVSKTPDYMASPSNCVAEVEEVPPTLPDCDDGDVQTETCGDCENGRRVIKECVGGVWLNRDGECEILFPCKKDCTGSPASRELKCNSCGTRTETQVCDEDTGQWTWTGSTKTECSKQPTECPKSCSASYCTPTGKNKPWKYHLASWYEDRKYYVDKTECCDANTACPESCPAGDRKMFDFYDPTEQEEVECCATPCPQSCPDGQKRTGQDYAQFGACCGYTCDSVCAHDGFWECRTLTSQLKANDPSRNYFWEKRSGNPTQTFYNGSNPYECVLCHLNPATDVIAREPDWKDMQGNVVNKGFDAATCSIAVSCPEGYQQAGDHKCSPIRPTVPVEHRINCALVHDEGHVGTAHAYPRCFTGGLPLCREDVGYGKIRLVAVRSPLPPLNVPILAGRQVSVRQSVRIRLTAL